ncbi:hypothetical protein NEDG_00005 [Nematocida displodere]|uniref:Uncharacterized protein n=1 Tax=Nematocida displodere TaxID=1805483 RepID=A0A177EJH0_9MICR|nr:hypothetical protein NEDG_00005 [Nematocida displodere]
MVRFYIYTQKACEKGKGQPPDTLLKGITHGMITLEESVPSTQKMNQTLFSVAPDCAPTTKSKRQLRPETPEPEHPPEVLELPRTQYTDETIMFFDIHRCKLDTLYTDQGRCLIKRQNKNMVLCPDLVDINTLPAKMEPGMVLEGLTIIPSAKNTLPTVPREWIAIMRKVFLAFSGVVLNMLSIRKIAGLVEDIPITTNTLAEEIPEYTTPEPAISLQIAKVLNLYKLSPSVLVWFCTMVDMRCRDRSQNYGIKVDLCSCNTTTIRHLDLLGINTISELHIVNMPKLKYLDCQEIAKSCVNGDLRLENLFRDIKIRRGVGKALGETTWNSVKTDLGIWNRFSRFLVPKAKPIGLVHLNLGGLGVVWLNGSIRHPRTIRTNTLIVVDNSGECVVPSSYFDNLMKWIYANVGKAREINIVVAPTQGSPNPNILEVLKTAVVDRRNLHNLERFTLDDVSVPITPLVVKVLDGNQPAPL